MLLIPLLHKPRQVCFLDTLKVITDSWELGLSREGDSLVCGLLSLPSQCRAPPSPSLCLRRSASDQGRQWLRGQIPRGRQLHTCSPCTRWPAQTSSAVGRTRTPRWAVGPIRCSPPSPARSGACPGLPSPAASGSKPGAAAEKKKVQKEKLKHSWRSSRRPWAGWHHLTRNYCGERVPSRGGTVPSGQGPLTTPLPALRYRIPDRKVLESLSHVNHQFRSVSNRGPQTQWEAPGRQVHRRVPIFPEGS